MSKIKNIKVINLIILLIGLSICIVNIGYKKYINIIDIIKAEKFLLNSKNNKSEYIGVLEIEKINLKRGFYNIGNKNNDVNKNIEIIKKSDMPNIQNGALIMAAHSGNGQVSHFKNLYKLVEGDIINVYYENKKYQYELINIYEIEKTGILKLDEESNFTSLILITCNKEKNDKQVVYVSMLKNIYNLKKID